MDFMSSGGNPQYFNRYAYTFNDPVNNLDPDGNQVAPSFEHIQMGAEFSKQRQAGLSGTQIGLNNLKQGAIGGITALGIIGAVYAGPAASSLGLGSTGTGLATAGIQSGSIGAVQSIANDSINNNGNVDLGDVAIDTAFNALGGVVGKAAGVPAIGSMIAETPPGAPLPTGVGFAQTSLGMQAGAVAGVAGSAVTGGSAVENARNAAFGAIGNLHPAFQILGGVGAISVESDCNKNGGC